MHFPVGGEKRIDVFRGEKIRCAVRAVQHGDVPTISVVRQQRSRQAHTGIGQFARGHEMQHVTHAQRASRMAAEAAQGEGRLCAEIVRHVETAGDREVGAQTRAGNAAHFQYGAGFDCMRLPNCKRFAV